MIDKLYVHLGYDIEIGMSINKDVVLGSNSFFVYIKNEYDISKELVKYYLNGDFKSLYGKLLWIINGVELGYLNHSNIIINVNEDILGKLYDNS